jgi:Copper amine oxidase N-terminal domain
MKILKSVVVALLIITLIQMPTFAVESKDLHVNEGEPFGFHPALVANRGYPESGYSDAQNISICWTRPHIYAFWFIIQPDLSKDRYDFRMHDRIYGEIPDDINILGNITADISGRGRRDATHDNYMKERSYEPVDIPMYEKFVKATVERYDGDGIDDMPGLTNPVKYWQVDNEPPRDGKTDFAVLQEVTYKAIKSACPDCQVMIGGATGFPDSFDNNFKAFTHILEDLNGEYVDIFDLHWYGNAFGEYRDLGDSLEIVKKVLAENGFEDIPIWITEMGSYSGEPKGRFKSQFPYQSEQMQAGDYLKRYIYSISIGVEKIFPAFGLLEGFKQDDGYFDHTGLIYDGRLSDDLGLGVKKLGYWTYKLMTETLIGSDWETLKKFYAEDNVYAYKVTKDNKPIWMIWWDWFDKKNYDEEDTKSVTIKLDGLDKSAELEIVETIPSAENGKELDENNYPNFFDTKIINSESGKITFELGKNPVFIRIETILEEEKPVTLKFKIDAMFYELNDEQIQMDSKPTILQDRTYLPARYVTEPLGGQVFWDGEERKVTCKLVAPDNAETEDYKENIVELWIGKSTAKVNGIEVQIDPNNPDVVPTIINDRTMVPMRFLAESLGCSVEWIAETKEIILTYRSE